jgi:hypothetical protein
MEELKWYKITSINNYIIYERTLSDLVTERITINTKYYPVIAEINVQHTKRKLIKVNKFSTFYTIIYEALYMFTSIEEVEKHFNIKNSISFINNIEDLYND